MNSLIAIAIELVFISVIFGGMAAYLYTRINNR